MFKNFGLKFLYRFFTLGKSHHEDQVNGDETQQIAHDHSVNHHDEWADRFETSAEEQKIRCRGEHDDHGQHIFNFVGADQSQKREG